jgi:hypothetical protein
LEQLLRKIILAFLTLNILSLQAAARVAELKMQAAAAALLP